MAFGKKNALEVMDIMEDHHPGRLKGGTERIPKIVHDIIHQDERDAVRDVFLKEGYLTPEGKKSKDYKYRLDPGRWTGKNIPEDWGDDDSPLENTNEPLVTNKKSFFSRMSPSELNTYSRLSPEAQNFVNERMPIYKHHNRDNYNNNFERTSNSGGWESAPSSQPAFVLGGAGDSEAMQRKRELQIINKEIMNAPSGYEGSGEAPFKNYVDIPCDGHAKTPWAPGVIKNPSLPK